VKIYIYIFKSKYF